MESIRDKTFIIYLLVVLSSFMVPLQSAEAAAAPFRVVTQSLPDGSTDGEYFAAILTSNATGPVTFTSNTLPPGLSIDSQTGFITGIPTTVDPNSPFDVDVDDGTTTLNIFGTVKITATGGGGNAGIAITSSFVDGEVSTAYIDTIDVGPAGTPPFIMGTQNLPVGLTLNGETGDVTGAPQEAGRFFVIISVVDDADKKITTTQPLLILPQGSTFQFTTEVMDNGDAGFDYSHFIAVGGETGSVAFSATGLPAGLSIDSVTGEITGIPTEPGTYEPKFTAVDDNGTPSDPSDDYTIHTNLRMWIFPSDTSTFYWDYFGVPAAMYGRSYGIQPPIRVITQNGIGPVVYSAEGLPTGIEYNPSTGELTGMSLEQGVFPVTFTAVDTGNSDETIILKTEFIVIPPKGGDTNNIAVNLWLKTLIAKDNGAGLDYWKGEYIYNANRSVGNAFDHKTDDFYASLNFSERTLAAGSLRKNLYRQLVFNDIDLNDPAEPGAKVKIAPKNQTMLVVVKNEGLGLTFPAESVENKISLGSRSYNLKIDLDEDPLYPNNPTRGKYIRTFGAKSTSFVVANGLLRTGDADFPKLTLEMYMADPLFNYAQRDPIELRVFNGAVEIFYKNITDFVITKDVDYKGQTVTIIKTPSDFTGDTGDVDGNDKLRKFVYHPGSGLMQLKIKKPTITPAEVGNAADGVHLGIEITIGEKAYFTSITFFEYSAGVYKTTMPGRLL
jgi:hypothetical protein